MNGYAVAYLLIQMLGLGVILAKSGEVTTIKFWPATIVWVGITLPLLYMAGTFN